MGFLNSIYEELRCRVCKKTFCCKDCRLRHEERTHLVMADCDICIYGKIAISKTHLTAELLQHLKDTHWPLHCVYCNRVFTSTAELSLQHNHICPIDLAKPEKLHTKTPKRIQESVDFESPPVQMHLQNGIAFTSTPMNPDYKSTLNVPEHIMPVESERMQTGAASTTAASESTGNNTTAKNKCRVTFVSTPGVENVQRKPKSHENFLKVSLKNTVIRQNDISDQVGIASTSEASERSEKSEKSDAMFVSATEKFLSETEIESEIIIQQTSYKKRRSYSLNETLWESAISESIAMHDISTESLNMSLLTKSHSAIFLQDTSTDCNTSAQKTGVWSSMTSLFRNVVQGFAARPPHPLLSESMKRHRSLTDCDGCDNEAVLRNLKKMKLCDIRCRRPIRANSRIVPKVDKSIQTDNNDDCCSMDI